MMAASHFYGMKQEKKECRVEPRHAGIVQVLSGGLQSKRKQTKRIMGNTVQESYCCKGMQSDLHLQTHKNENCLILPAGISCSGHNRGVYVHRPVSSNNLQPYPSMQDLSRRETGMVEDHNSQKPTPWIRAD
mmetsp:Transcript_5435/g.19122  ORF Transcript_5435/g.19122 Transcript_5435/m.19122 type:complete len:132 (-) Transcript_5435:390-785(-)